MAIIGNFSTVPKICNGPVHMDKAHEAYFAISGISRKPKEPAILIFSPSILSI